MKKSRWYQRFEVEDLTEILAVLLIGGGLILNALMFFYDYKNWVDIIQTIVVFAILIVLVYAYRNLPKYIRMSGLSTKGVKARTQKRIEKDLHLDVKDMMLNPDYTGELTKRFPNMMARVENEPEIAGQAAATLTRFFGSLVLDGIIPLLFDPHTRTGQQVKATGWIAQQVGQILPLWGNSKKEEKEEEKSTNITAI